MIGSAALRTFKRISPWRSTSTAFTEDIEDIDVTIAWWRDMLGGRAACDRDVGGAAVYFTDDAIA